MEINANELGQNKYIFCDDEQCAQTIINFLGKSSYRNDNVIIFDDVYFEKNINIKELLKNHNAIAIGNFTDLKADVKNIKKPFRISQLTKILKEFDEVFKLNENFIFNSSKRTITNINDNKNHQLREKESDLLHELLKSPKVNKDQLLQKIWGYDSQIQTNTLQTHIYRLKTALDKIGIDIQINSENEEYIVTIGQC